MNGSFPGHTNMAAVLATMDQWRNRSAGGARLILPNAMSCQKAA